MVNLLIDKPEVEHNLRRIIEIIVDNGGYIDEKLVIHGCEGQLAVLAPFDVAPSTPIIVVPRELLLPVDELELSLEGDMLQILSFKNGTPSIRKEMARLMIELFNNCNKIAWHKRVTPWIYHYEDPELFKFLVSGREPENGFPFLHNTEAKDINALLIHTFLMTRWLLVDHGPNTKSVAALMPIVDLVNHHPNGRPYHRNVDENGSVFLQIYKSSCKYGSDESFVSYGIRDAHDILLFYNYVEADTFFLQSAPFEMELPGIGKLHVSNAMESTSADNLPDNLRDLSIYFPAVKYNPLIRQIDISRLMIPQQNAPRALRRIIGAILQSTTPGISERQTRKLVSLVENRVIASTMDNYHSMKMFLQNYQPDRRQETVVNMALQVADIQINKLSFYKDKIMSCSSR